MKWNITFKVQRPCQAKVACESKSLSKPNEKKVHKSETQVKWAGQQLQSSNFANAFVQEIPRKEVTILFRTRKLKIHDLRVLS